MHLTVSECQIEEDEHVGAQKKRREIGKKQSKRTSVIVWGGRASNVKHEWPSRI